MSNTVNNTSLEKDLQVDWDAKEVYKTFYNQHIDATFVLDLEGKIQNVNESAERLIGCSKMDLLNQPFLPMVEKGKRVEMIHLFRRVMKGQPQETKCSINSKLSSTIIVNFVAVPIKQNDRIIGVVGVANDITQQVTLEREMKQSHERFKSVFENHPDAVYTIDLQGNIQYCNDVVLEFTGLSREEISKPFYELLAPEYQAYAMKKFNEALSGDSVKYHAVLIRADGKSLDFHMTHIPMFSDGNVTGVFGISKNISELREYEEKLSKAQKELSLVQFVSNVGNWDYDVISKEAIWSEQLYRIYGIEDIENFKPSLGNYLSMVHPDDADEFKKNCMDAYFSGEAFSFEYRIIRKDGVERIVHEQGNTIRAEDGTVRRMIGTVHDITEYRQTEARLEQTEAQAQTIYNNLKEVIWSIDIKNRSILFCTDEFEELCGFKLQEVLQNPTLWDRYIHRDDAKKIVEIMTDIRNGKEIFEQYRLRHFSGEVKWINVKAIPFCDQEGKLIRLDGIMWDVTEQKKAEEKLYKAAFQDYLTELPNRRSFENYIETAIKLHHEERETFALLYLDLDRFNAINDRLGHSVGDELLKQVAQRLKNCSENHFSARLSGDEFAVCIPRLQTTAQAINAAQEIMEALEQPFRYRDYDLFISASIGISIYPMDGDHAAELVKNADTALSHAKEKGKNTYQVYTKEMNQESFRKYCLERDMRKAIELNEFEVYYQPKVDAKAEEIIGAEALLRWEHKRFGSVSPGEFIPIAEDSGFITEIGTWVFKNVCQQLKEWEKNDLPFVPISINISPQHFLKKDIIELVKTSVAEFGIDPASIELEITETSLIHYSEVVQNTMSTLKDIGVKISLDDFGTGYSSLSQLQNFQFDTLKIDQSFIKNVLIKKEDSVITSSLISLAHGLGMNVVAEGVELEEQLEYLKQNDCDQIQGYIYSKPLRVKDFEDLLKKGLFN
ncbi:EAL domain-containing protein [Ornithinibacillus xuwenensis]|uniref:EAL domain-containing protein n=1 Tax=Ornithinibacillus xuwenensis TaxID=3144668 RepID=A0ABU9XIW6_9BACI